MVIDIFLDIMLWISNNSSHFVPRKPFLIKSVLFLYDTEVPEFFNFLYVGGNKKENCAITVLKWRFS